MIFCVWTKNVQWQEKCFFFVFKKKLSEWCETVKWYGNMNCLFHAWLDTLLVLPSNVSLNLIQNLGFMFIYSQVLYQSILLLYTIQSPTPFSCTSRPWRWDNTQPEQAGRQCWVGILLVSCSSRLSLYLSLSLSLTSCPDHHSKKETGQQCWVEILCLLSTVNIKQSSNCLSFFIFMCRVGLSVTTPKWLNAEKFI